MAVARLRPSAAAEQTEDLGPDLEVDTYFSQSVSIGVDLEEEFIRNPADIAYWGERLTLALEAKARAEREKDTVKARLSLDARQRLTAAGVGGNRGPSNDAVSEQVESNPEMVAARNDVLEAEIEVARFQNRLNAVRAKKDALVALGALKRLEWRLAEVTKVGFTEG